MFLLVDLYAINRNIYAFISQLYWAVCQFLDNGRAHFGQPGIQIGLVTQDAIPATVSMKSWRHQAADVQKCELCGYAKPIPMTAGSLI